MSVFKKRLFGIGLIVGLAVAVVLGVTQPQPFADRHTYYAMFDSAQGLGPIDRDIRIAGVKIGEMGSVERIDDNVRVSLHLGEDHPVRADARVDMRPHTLFEGSNFVDLYPGSPSAPLLEEGAEIPLEQTSNYTTLDEALRVLRPQIRNSLRSLAGSGAELLQGEAVTGIQRTLRGLPRLARSLGPAARAAQGEGREELAGAIRGAARTVDEVAEQEAQLAQVPPRLNRTARALAVDGGAPLDRALAALPATLRSLDGAAPELVRVIDSLETISHAVNPHLSTLATAIGDTTPVLARANPVLERGTPLIRDARALTARLGEAGDGLIEMFRLLDQPLDLFAETLAVVNEPTVHGAPAYRQLVAGAFAGGASVFRSYQTRAQNPASPGHMLRIGVVLSPFQLGGFGEMTELLGGGAAVPLVEPPTDARLGADCDDVEAVSESAARALAAIGGCK